MSVHSLISVIINYNDIQNNLRFWYIVFLELIHPRGRPWAVILNWWVVTRFQLKWVLKGIFSSRATQHFGVFCLALNLKYVCFGNCNILHNVRFELQRVLTEYWKTSWEPLALSVNILRNTSCRPMSLPHKNGSYVSKSHTSFMLDS